MYLPAPCNSSVTKTSKLSTPISCSEDTKVCDAIRILATNGVHRLYVINDTYRPTGVVTLSDLVQILRII